MWLIGDTQMFLGVLEVFTSFITAIPSHFGLSTPDVVLRYDFPQSQIDTAKSLIRNEFPKDFMFGVATSAYQTEGAWNVGGKSESAWDHMLHENPSLVRDKSNGDVATNSYYMYKEDIQMAKSIGVKMYRFSLSWTRLLPNGYSNKVNEDGVRYYNDVINEMIANDITPIVTLFHWDLPYNLQQLGGFTNPMIVTAIVDYAKIAFALFGDRVKHWITINEPHMICTAQYAAEVSIPGYNQSGIVDYLCGHNILLSHSAIYRMYNRDFRWHQNGKIGISLDLMWPVGERNIEDDLEAVERHFQWFDGWFLHPLFSEYGDYPDMMKNIIHAKSHQQGFSQSRLPTFTEEEKENVRGSADFLGINFYCAKLVRSSTIDNSVSFMNDVNVEMVDDTWPGDVWVKQTPWALRALLHRVNTDYNLPEIYITENGYSDRGTIQDINRATYHHQHLFEILRALKGGVDIKGYMTWSLLDNFEWLQGYTVKFGLFYVDFNDDNRRRTPKLSSKVVADIYKTRRIRPMEEVLNSFNVESKDVTEEEFKEILNEKKEIMALEELIHMIE